MKRTERKISVEDRNSRTDIRESRIEDTIKDRQRMYWKVDHRRGLNHQKGLKRRDRTNFKKLGQDEIKEDGKDDKFDTIDNLFNATFII